MSHKTGGGFHGLLRAIWPVSSAQTDAPSIPDSSPEQQPDSLYDQQEDQPELYVGEDPDTSCLNGELYHWLQTNPYTRAVVFDSDPKTPLFWMQGVAACTDLQGRSLYFLQEQEERMLAALYVLLRSGYSAILAVSGQVKNLRGFLLACSWTRTAMENGTLTLLARGWGEANISCRHAIPAGKFAELQLFLQRSAFEDDDWLAEQKMALPQTCQPAAPQPVETGAAFWLGFTVAWRWKRILLHPGHMICLRENLELKTARNLMADLVDMNLLVRAANSLFVVYFTNRDLRPEGVGDTLQFRTLPPQPNWEQELKTLGESMDSWGNQQVDLLVVFDLDCDLPPEVVEQLRLYSELAADRGLRIYFLYAGEIIEDVRSADLICEEQLGVCSADSSSLPFQIPHWTHEEQP